MKQVKLTKGQVALVDDEDYEAVTKYSWTAAEACGGGYYAKGWNKVDRLHYMHRFILERMLGRPIGKNMCSDHINGNKLDNRRCNLREITQSQNRYNSARCKNAKGVYFDKKGKSYFTAISINGKQVRFGKFSTKEEAYEKFLEQKRKIMGDFSA